ncbi:MAG: hypothetical protein IT168_02305 [Bryobacterales bacterium]|nr:hypothetical protein [Bryobacterales bacterium]
MEEAGASKDKVKVEFQANGICLPEIGLWLDPREARGKAWLSHAHSDHAWGLHSEAWGTPDTLRLYRMRWTEQESVPQRLCPVDYRESFEVNGARCTAVPAGHILGAAQLLVEFGGERLVYTGDIKWHEPLCGPRTEIAPCDRLIIESTFGLPIYHFLSREQARERIVQFARETLADGGTPAFLGYPLGRGQEIAHVLCSAGIQTAVHGAIARYIPVYEEAGYGFDGWEPYEPRQRSNKALVVVPGMRNVLEAAGKDIRIAYVSGWAALANARTRAGAEELIPYSDHAGFKELLEIIERSGARRVDLVHGYTELLARILRQRGLEACAALSETEADE